jgi:pyrimidine-specific ribonucleoside hydrolase
MKRIIILLIGLTLTLCVNSHPWKPSHYVIIDTDGGIDDIRTISMFLASPDIRVLAITISPGVLSTENAFIKVKSLLDSFYHEGIPVGINRDNKFVSDNFPVAHQTIWGEETGINPEGAPEAIDLINDILKVEKTKVSFICLGSMSTAYLALRKTDLFRQQVKEMLWSANGAGVAEGFNYNIDKIAADKMLKQEILVKVIRKYYINSNNFYDDELIKSIGEVNTIYAKKISAFFNSENAKTHLYSYAGTDEMVAVFIHYPDLFINKTSGFITDCTPSDMKGIKEGTIKILKGETVARNQVIKELPTAPSFYFDDIKPYVNEIVNKYGIDEWSSGVLANELHRHLGVFAIIGVKMGIRAREYFDTGVDEFTATSFAGSMPPLSCMHDGIQVSTGATPGHGLLTVRNDTALYPSVEFTYLNRKIRLTLKPEIAEKIISELKEINFIYGLDSNIYWEMVRKNTIKYWLNLDRHDIFKVEGIN